MASKPPIFYAHGDADQWAAAAATNIATALQDELERKGKARLLLSGGTTPAPVYRALATSALDWAKVDVALVDERWLPAGDPNSNARLIQETLLTGRAAAAHFHPMLSSDRSLHESVVAANRVSGPASVVVLGMGADGHTASLFPNMRGFDQAMLSSADYTEVDASESPGAGAWPRRISLTPAGLAKATHRVLLITGEHKRALIERALEGVDPRELPIRIALSLPGEALHIHWCP